METDEPAVAAPQPSRRTTEPAIAAAIALGWRVAELYGLRPHELPSSPPDNLLPVRASLPAPERLALELRAAAGVAARAGAGAAPVDELLALAGAAVAGGRGHDAFRARVRAWHVELATELWAAHEARGKAYELGSFLSDSWNRVVPARRDGDRGRVADELAEIFSAERVERIGRLLDDLQARIDPAAAQVVRRHLVRWRQAVGGRPGGAGAGAALELAGGGLDALRRQAVTWLQLVTGDKEPEAFLDHHDRARIRDRLVRRLALAYRAKLAAAGAAAAALAVLGSATSLEALMSTELLAALAPLAGALGVSAGSIALTVRRSLDARAELVWNAALVDAIAERTLLVDELLHPPPSRRARAARPLRRAGARVSGAPRARRPGSAASPHPPARGPRRHATS